MTDTKFEIKGGFDIDERLKPLNAANGEVIGYKLPDGRIVRLVMALEIENPDNSFNYVTSEKEMDALGFQNLDYSVLSFFPSAH